MIYFLLALICLMIWLPIQRYRMSEDTRREIRWEMFIYGAPIKLVRLHPQPRTVEEQLKFWSPSWKERDVQ